MRVLGRGWQYTTYDLGNGRVLKRYNSMLVAFWVMFADFLHWHKPAPWKFLAYHRSCKQKARESLEQVRRGVLESWMTGNARLLGDLSYEQDKLVPLHTVFESVSTEEGKRLIDAFVAFNEELLKRSLIDKSFNITKNFGINAEGRVVLMDLGELLPRYINSYTSVRGRRRTWRRLCVIVSCPTTTWLKWTAIFD